MQQDASVVADSLARSFKNIFANESLEFYIDMQHAQSFRLDFVTQIYR